MWRERQLVNSLQKLEMHAFIWEKTASFHTWRETACKPPSKMEMYAFVWG
jgi:hypothetical protein